ncbi:MAG: roadblock/LC7 domain-containing protein [Candidatus Micrarchaeota archaeon]
MLSTERKNTILFFLSFLVLTLAFGCVSENEALFPGNEKIAKTLSADRDGDGSDDFWTYEFQPQKLGDNLTLTRVLIIQFKPDETLYVLPEQPIFAIINKTALADARASIASFKESRINEDACKEILGIDRFECFDTESCLKACYAPACKDSVAAYGESFLFSIRDFSSSLNALDSSLDSFEENLNDAESTDSEQSFELALLNLKQAKQSALEISGSGLFSTSVYYFCAPIDYDVTAIDDAARSLHEAAGVYIPTRTQPNLTGEYSVAAYLTISDKNPSSLVITEVKITERIPDELKGVNLRFETNYTERAQEDPLVVSWKFTTAGEQALNKTLSYSSNTRAKISKEWVASLQQARVSVRKFDPSSSPIMQFGGASILGAYKSSSASLGPYAGLGVVLALVIAFLFIAWSFVKIIIGLVNAVKNRQDLGNALFEIAGTGKKDNSIYMGLAVVLIIAGYVLSSSGTSSQMLQDPTFDQLINMISAEPIKATGAILLALGGLSLYFVVIDVLKGLVLGPRYFETRVKGVRAALRETEVGQVIRKVRDELHGIPSSFAEPTSAGFSFVFEQQQINEMLKILEKAEEDAGRDEFSAASRNVNKVERMLDSLKRKIREKIEVYHYISSQRANVNELASAIKVLAKNCESVGVSTNDELTKLASANVERTLGVIRDFCTSDSFKEADSEIGKLLKTLTALRQSLDEKLQKQEILLGRQFACPGCGKQITILDETCLHCKTSMLSSISNSTTKLKEEISELMKRISDAKEMIDFAFEERALSDVEHALDEVLKESQEKQFDKAFDSLASVRVRYETAKKAVEEKLASQKDLEARLETIREAMEETVNLLSKAKKLGINVLEEEQLYQTKNREVDSLLAEADNLCASKRYSEATEKLQKAEKQYSELKSSMQEKLKYGQLISKQALLERESKELKALLGKAVSEGINVSEESERLFSIRIPSVSGILSQDEFVETKSKLENALESVEGSIASANQKLSILARWGDWSESIASQLSITDRVAQSALLSIPEKWRAWAVTRYLNEHIGESLSIESGALIKLRYASVPKEKLEELLKILTASGKVEAAALIRRDGLMMASQLPEGVASSTVAAISSKMMTNAEMVAKELKTGMVKRVLIVSESGRTVVRSAGRSSILLCLVKPKEEIGFILMAMDTVGAKIADLLEAKS